MTTQNIPGKEPADVQADLISRIAHATRTLRDSMRELGLDQAVKDAAHAIPDARERLHYVAQMTEQAADRVLGAAERVRPWQGDLRCRAEGLDERWRHWFDQPMALEQARDLVDDTRAFLGEIPPKAQETQDALMEIILAQDFQDLTGQVIMRMLQVVGAIETELVQVLIDSVPPEKRDETRTLLNGPVTEARPGSDVVTGQDQVDDLLASLGF